jgi:DNA invertase Pin-like site-specific DNA recombinase
MEIAAAEDFKGLRLIARAHLEKARSGDMAAIKALAVERFFPRNAACKTSKLCSFLLTSESRRFIPAYLRRKSHMEGKNMPLFGYARVSTRDQNLVAQDAELRAAGCAKVFKEKISGAKTDRPELVKAIGWLEPGDVLVVTRLDRLARSTRDLLNVIAAVTERGAGFKSLKDAWADTTSAHGRLMLTVLGGLAEFERELIRARTGEGRKRAKERGVRFGRPRKMTPHQRQEALQRLAAGETQADVARTYNVDATTIGRLLGDRPFHGGASLAGLQ